MGCTTFVLLGSPFKLFCWTCERDSLFGCKGVEVGVELNRCGSTSHSFSPKLTAGNLSRMSGKLFVIVRVSILISVCPRIDLIKYAYASAKLSSSDEIFTLFPSMLIPQRSFTMEESKNAPILSSGIYENWLLQSHQDLRMLLLWEC